MLARRACSLVFRPGTSLKRLKTAIGVLAVLFTTVPVHRLAAPQESEPILDITGEYHFLSAEDALALLEEEGKLKGYVDVSQTDEESDAVLTFNIVSGERKKQHVEFKTGRIHQKYYRFSGTVERGKGHEEKDPDYLRLTGDLEIVTTKTGSIEEAVQRLHVIFKSKGKSETAEE